MGGTRRRFPVGVLAAVLGTTGLSSCASSQATTANADQATEVRAEYYASEYGVRVGIRVSFEQARTVTGATLLVGAQSSDATLYPLDGSDPDMSPKRVALDRGQGVLVEGTLLVSCNDGPATPVFEVASESDGSRQADYFRPANPDGFDQAVREWCDRPVTMNVTGMSATPTGDYEIYIAISNPGPEPVEVKSAATSDAGSAWEATSEVVPAGTTQMTIKGHGPPECAITPPWRSGAITVDGDVITPESTDWC